VYNPRASKSWDKRRRGGPHNTDCQGAQGRTARGPYPDCREAHGQVRAASVAEGRDGGASDRRAREQQAGSVLAGKQRREWEQGRGGAGKGARTW